MADQDATVGAGEEHLMMDIEEDLLDEVEVTATNRDTPEVELGDLDQVDPATFNAESYNAFIKQATDKHYTTLEKVMKMIAKTEKGRFIRGLYVIIKIVQQPPEHVLQRTIHVYDPSMPQGVALQIPKSRHQFKVGNILRISEMSIKDHALQLDKVRIHEINSFAYDYDAQAGSQRLFEQQFFQEPFDRTVSKALEGYLASRLLASSFSTLPLTSVKEYRDFVCQVIQRRPMRLSTAVSVWDGTQPSRNTIDPYNPEYVPQQFQLTGCITSTNEEMYEYAKSRLVHINIWRNQSGERCDHHTNASSLSLINGDDLLAIFNCEVNAQSDTVQLIMRSGHHQGKAVRKVLKDSLLGRGIRSQIEKVVLSEQKQLDAIRASMDITLSEEELTPITTAGTQTQEPQPLIPSTSGDRPGSQMIPHLPDINQRPASADDSEEGYILTVNTPNCSSVAGSVRTATPTSVPAKTPSPIPAEQPPPRQSTPTGRPNTTQVTRVDEGEEVRDLIGRMPPGYDFEAIKDMPLRDLVEMKRLIEISDSVSDLRLEFGPNFSRKDFIDVLKLAIHWKRAAIAIGQRDPEDDLSTDQDLIFGF